MGALGFLSNQENGINGNYGIMDQILALQWVQQNIKSFGGDNNKVIIITLFLYLKIYIIQIYLIYFYIFDYFKFFYIYFNILIINN